MRTTRRKVKELGLGCGERSARVSLGALNKEKNAGVSSNSASAGREWAPLQAHSRGRKTRYRAPRFDNRRRPDGWLAPSVQHKADCHLNRIAFVHKILPVTKIMIECAAFDTQKLKNPDMHGKEYQQGEQLGFWNVREYVLFRDGHKCFHCGKKDVPLNVHHLESRKTGGDSPSNLITLCEECHRKYHALSEKQRAKWKLPKRAPSYRDAAFMGIMRWAVYGALKEQYQDVTMTFGYITKNTRISLRLEKSHVNDAFCIAGNPGAKPLKTVLVQKKVRRNNRQVYKATTLKGGIRKKNQAPYEVRGFRLFDKVMYLDAVCFVTGRRQSGYFTLKTLKGTAVHKSARASDLVLLERCKGYLQDKEARQFLSHLPPCGA